MGAESDWRVPGFDELAELGAGSQGRAVLVREEATGRLAVLKYAAAHDETARDRFRKESVLLKEVLSPYVARWYGHFEGPGTAAILMEAVDGVSLQTLLVRNGAMPPEAALAILKGSLLGLSAAHDRGVVHGDYKPSNVVVSPRSTSKLVDFGIAGLAGERSAGGTPRYMAPEQWARGKNTPATDVYAATCVFFECITGEPPYSGDLREQHTSAALPVDRVPSSLRPLVEQGMAKAPEARPENAAAFVNGLEAVAGTAFGPGWEERGWTVLRQGALALAALSPLAVVGAALAPGSTGGGTAGLAAHAGHGAMRAGSRAAGKSWLGSVSGSKAVIAIAGAAVVGAAGTAGVVVANSGHGPAAAPASKTASPKLVLTTTTQQYDPPPTPGALIQGPYIAVRGTGDPALIARINAALRKPLEDQTAQEIAEYKAGIAQYGKLDPVTAKDCKPGFAKVESATVALQRPTLLAVSYRLHLASCFHDGAGGMANVLVDLTTGRQLTADDIFQPAVMTESGVGTLLGRLKLQNVDPECDGTYAGRPNIFLRNLRSQKDPAIAFAPIQPVLLTGDGLTIAVAVDHLCGHMYWNAPYSAVRDLIQPGILARL